MFVYAVSDISVIRYATGAVYRLTQNMQTNTPHTSPYAGCSSVAVGAVWLDAEILLDLLELLIEILELCCVEILLDRVNVR